MYYPTLEEVKKCEKVGNLVPVYREIIADLETPVSAFLKINRGFICLGVNSMLTIVTPKRVAIDLVFAPDLTQLFS
jgi:hypothetical protein